MIVSNIKSYTSGWFIGNFEPTLLKTEAFEVAHHFYHKGFKATPHIHKIATEYNYIINGQLIVSGKSLSSGDIFVYELNDISDVQFLEDTNLIIIKTPSIPTDKYEI
jgi:hypothetical protein